MRKTLLVLLFFMFFVGCNDVPDSQDEETNYLNSLREEYTLFEGEQLNINNEIKNTKEEILIENNSPILFVENNIIKALSKGETFINISILNEEKKVKIIVLEKTKFKINNVTLFLGETKELEIDIVKGDISKLKFECNNDNIKIVDRSVEGLKVGVTKVTATIEDTSYQFEVVVKDWEIEILNESFDVDLFSTLEIKLKYPNVYTEQIKYTITKEEIIKIENNIIYPLKEGSTRVKAKLGDNDNYSVTFTVKVFVDPIEIIKKLHNEEALMKKKIILYGETNYEQPLLGSVSKYLFADLNLKKSIIDIYENPYVGQIATKEIVASLDRKGYPRSGVKMDKIEFITYHDTWNSNPGADAQANANWMINTASVSTSARSWHYTVDQNCVIQSIPDDEITWQGDHYDAYTKSIGIETCVNKGANMNVVWHRMGKLCAQLIKKYDLSIDDIKQHYNWNGKDCPKTLRNNKLYSYAISLVEGELLYRIYLMNYDVSFESLNPEYLDNTGQIIKAPDSEINVGYTVTIKNNKEYNETITLYTKVSPLK